jgi:hypothetical protein
VNFTLRAALVQHQPAALDRQLQASTVFGRRSVLPKQERPVDLLDMDAAVLRGLSSVGDLQDLAGGRFGIGLGQPRVKLRGTVFAVAD